MSSWQLRCASSANVDSSSTTNNTAVTGGASCVIHNSTSCDNFDNQNNETRIQSSKDEIHQGELDKTRDDGSSNTAARLGKQEQTFDQEAGKLQRTRLSSTKQNQQGQSTGTKESATMALQIQHLAKAGLSTAPNHYPSGARIGVADDVVSSSSAEQKVMKNLTSGDQNSDTMIGQRMQNANYIQSNYLNQQPRNLNHSSTKMHQPISELVPVSGIARPTLEQQPQPTLLTQLGQTAHNNTALLSSLGEILKSTQHQKQGETVNPNMELLLLQGFGNIQLLRQQNHNYSMGGPNALPPFGEVVAALQPQQLQNPFSSICTTSNTMTNTIRPLQEYDQEEGGTKKCDDNRYAANEDNQNTEFLDTIRTFPCKARGMPSDHDCLNAYFTVQEDTMHGQDLFCSHAACRSGGVRFQYCLYCKRPVAKRNFRHRHSHPDLVPTPPGTKVLEFSVPKQEHQAGVGTRSNKKRRGQTTTIAASVPQSKKIYVASNLEEDNLLTSQGIKRRIDYISTSKGTATATASGTDGENRRSNYEVIHQGNRQGSRSRDKKICPNKLKNNTDHLVSSRTKTKTKRSTVKEQSISLSCYDLCQDDDRGQADRFKNNENPSSIQDPEGNRSTMAVKAGRGAKNHQKIEVLDDYKKAWNCLLHERPDAGEGDEMSKWLMRIFGVSASYKKLNQALLSHHPLSPTPPPPPRDEDAESSSSSVSSNNITTSSKYSSSISCCDSSGYDTSSS